ncbi:uncharacterized protein LOC100891083 [Strongylocentrotus purpuratus]|uniref:Uncharacterized protein n=1 Tax=Strongylocentrotus purpuratus TaxID=7668 RepID=A0A7M7HH99_STRPU|nr:uncharacterized protein LOC100891083 [Strongylocentrotus purpuratus]|eukprot:XP_011668113.1 PREDICTED: uncharacterized protein LOC100891083 isoform X2 [Strongylocentrotus purpuratus]
METHNANIIHGKASTEGHNGGLHLPCNGVEKEGMSKERESNKTPASNGTCTMAIGTKSTNNQQRYMVTEQKNGRNGKAPKEVKSRAEGKRGTNSPKPKPRPSPKRHVSNKVDPKKSPPKKKKKKRNFRLGLGVRQRVDYGKLDTYNSRVGLSTGILQLVLSLEAVTLGALQCYFRPEYANIASVLFVWPSVGLCILSGIFGTWSHRKGTYVVYLYMLVSIFACITSCMMFGLEVQSSKELQRMCSESSVRSTSDDVTATNISDVVPADCSQNYGLNMAIAVILSIIALFQILISFVAAIGSSNVMCSKENHEILVEECLSDDDDGEPPPPNAGLPQIKRAAKRK